MRIPVWFALTVAAFVTLFGAYRIKLGLTKKTESDEAPKRGFYAMSSRTHLFIGTIYILMGAALTAMGFGWQPFGNSVGPDTEVPSKDKAPTKGGVPIDQLPTKK